MSDQLVAKDAGYGNFPQRLKDMGDGSWAEVVAILDDYTAAAALAWTSATAVNTANTVTTTGYDGVMISIVTAGTVTGGTVVFEVYDGAAWIPVQAGLMNAYGGATSVNPVTGMAVGYQINISGGQQFRTRLSSAVVGSGTVTITHLCSSAPMPDPLTVGVDPAAAGTAGVAAVLSPATPAGQIAKNTAARLGGWSLSNTATSFRSVKFFNAATVTMGTTAALFEIDLPPNGVSEVTIPAGLALSTGLAIAVTAGKGLSDNTATGLAANDVAGVVFYA